MAIYMGETPKILFKGDYHPAEMYKGEKKFTGYEIQAVSGEEISVENTYNDGLTPSVKGNGMQSGTPTPDAPSYPAFSEGALNCEGRNLLPDTAVFTNSTRDGDVFTFADQVYDRILRKEYWTPKEDTDYTIVLDILENTFTESMKLTSDTRFYFETFTAPIPIGTTGRVAVNVKTWSSFDGVTSGSIWLNSYKTAIGTFRAKVSILLGTYTADNLPDYQPYRPPVSIDLPVLRAIPDGNGGFSARDSLTPVEGMPGWYDLRREVGEKVVTVLEKNNTDAGSYTYRCHLPGTKIQHSLCSHFRYQAEEEPETFHIFSALNSQYLGFWLEGLVSGDNATLTDDAEAMAWLASQTEAGTPLTVWYPLESPTTERIELGELNTYPYYTHIYSDCAVKLLIEGEVKTIGGQT